MAKRKLLGVGGSVNVRATRTAADGATWSPDNLSGGETGAGIVADDVTLLGEDWESVYVIAEFAGAPGGTETVTIQPLRAVWKSAAPGRDWIPFGAAIVIAAPANGKSALVAINRAATALRITALTLGGATSVTLRVTSGEAVARPR